ncbi:hypothetical protein [Photobacterium leiognathi]|uniref:hypothetical protein n=1 Tax=Photobacterium leiognathi TaxID=553611 RepID=UPI002982648B|nr:hypothetical protein [Photobacterium leiognathi]
MDYGTVLSDASNNEDLKLVFDYLFNSILTDLSVSHFGQKLYFKSSSGFSLSELINEKDLNDLCNREYCVTRRECDLRQSGIQQEFIGKFNDVVGGQEGGVSQEVELKLFYNLSSKYKAHYLVVLLVTYLASIFKYGICISKNDPLYKFILTRNISITICTDLELELTINSLKKYGIGYCNIDDVVIVEPLYKQADSVIFS